MTSIKRYARYFEILCMIVIPLLPAWSVFMWFFGDKLMDSTYCVDLANLSLLQRSAALCVDLVSNALVIYGMTLCIKIARLLQKDGAFTHSTVTFFTRLSKVSAYWGLYNMATVIGYYTFVMVNMPLRVRMLGLVSSGLFFLFIFVFLSVLATIVSKACVLQNDSDLTV